jgi:hypothetical protein
MTFDEIVNAARDSTGLTNPDQDSWQEGLQILLRDHARADILTEKGEEIIRRRCISTLWLAPPYA